MKSELYHLVLPDSAGNPFDCTGLVQSIVDTTEHPAAYQELVRLFINTFAAVYLRCGEQGVTAFETHVAALQDRKNGIEWGFDA